MDVMSWAELAQSTSAALIAAITTDAWTHLRDRAAALLGGTDPARREAASVWLADVEQAVEAGTGDDRRDRLAQLLVSRLVDEPALAGEMQALLHQARAALPDSAGAPVVQHAVASGRSRITQAGRDVVR